MGSIYAVPTIRYSVDHDGIEVLFPEKPDTSTIAKVKDLGFRWSGRAKLWYKRMNPFTWEKIHAALGLPAAPIPQDAFRRERQDDRAAILAS